MNDHVVDASEVNNTQYGEAYEETSLTQAANITDPVYDVVDLAVDHGQVEVHLIRDRDVHRVIEFIWALSRLL